MKIWNNVNVKVRALLVRLITGNVKASTSYNTLYSLNTLVLPITGDSNFKTYFDSVM